MKSFLLVKSPADINLFINIILHAVYTLHTGWVVLYQHHLHDILKQQIQTEISLFSTYNGHTVI